MGPTTMIRLNTQGLAAYREAYTQPNQYFGCELYEKVYPGMYGKCKEGIVEVWKQGLSAWTYDNPSWDRVKDLHSSSHTFGEWGHVCRTPPSGGASGIPADQTSASGTRKIESMVNVMCKELNGGNFEPSYISDASTGGKWVSTSYIEKENYYMSAHDSSMPIAMMEPSCQGGFNQDWQGNFRPDNTGALSGSEPSMQWCGSDNMWDGQLPPMQGSPSCDGNKKIVSIVCVYDWKGPSHNPDIVG